MNRSVIALLVALACNASPVAAQQAPRAAKAAAPASTTVLNLNSATAAQIATLPGIGQKTAELVVQYRQKNGPFKKIEEIMNVRGIGEKSFLRIKDRLSVSAPKTEK